MIVDKPAGLTSHDVVARVRRLAGTRKVGHAGTLDPMATGVLVVGVNRATRLLGHLMLTEKAYHATIRLGASTTTDDADGELVATRSAARLSAEDVQEALSGFVGEIEQVPSAVSAIKLHGQRAYRLVREGVAVELSPRPVTVHELTVRGSVATGQDLVDLTVAVRCSSGTYVRAIARDLGVALGVGGHLAALRRTAVGGFLVDRSHTLVQLAESLTMIDLAAAARTSFPTFDLTAEQATDVRFGRPLPISLPQVTAVFGPAGDFLALYRSAERPPAEHPVAGGSAIARPVAVFVG
ncbi:MAG: tRNA pseudouridine(55) synthase TruB [Nocardioides sp.]